MSAFIFKIVVGTVLILAGLLWMCICALAGNMSDRPVNWLKEIWLPSALGLIPIAIGIWMLCK